MDFFQEKLRVRDRVREKVFKAAGRALKEYGMIANGDRILVAVSGGVDSLVLLDVLSHKRRIVPVSFDIIPLHVRPRGLGWQADETVLEKLCERHGLVMEYREFEIDPGEVEDGKSICHLCAMRRRSLLFRAAEELSCQSLALGHHMDDAVETLLMNMAFNGTVSSMPGKLSMFDGSLFLVRPLIGLRRHEIEAYASRAGLPLEGPVCHHEKQNRREIVREILYRLQEVDSKTVTSLFRSMSNIHGDYLP